VTFCFAEKSGIILIKKPLTSARGEQEAIQIVAEVPKETDKEDNG